MKTIFSDNHENHVPMLNMMTLSYNIVDGHFPIMTLYKDILVFDCICTVQRLQNNR